jgi:hypothetical protein
MDVDWMGVESFLVYILPVASTAHISNAGVMFCFPPHSKRAAFIWNTFIKHGRLLVFYCGLQLTWNTDAKTKRQISHLRTDHYTASIT